MKFELKIDVPVGNDFITYHTIKFEAESREKAISELFNLLTGEMISLDLHTGDTLIISKELASKSTFELIVYKEEYKF
jgi:hypothetical protein